MTYMFDIWRLFLCHTLNVARAAVRIGSLTCFGCGLNVRQGNVPRRVVHETVRWLALWSDGMCRAGSRAFMASAILMAIGAIAYNGVACSCMPR